MEMFRRNGVGPYEVENPTGKSSLSFLLTGEACYKCGGVGGAEAWKHTGWTCYRCKGTGKEAAKTIRVYTKAHIEALDAKLAVKRAKQAVEAEKKAVRVKEDALARLDDVTRVELQEHSSGNEFLESLLARVIAGGTLSEKQVEAVAEHKARREADALAGDCPEGRIKMRVKLLHTKFQESQYGGTLKGLWRAEEGFKVWGSITPRLEEALEAVPVGEYLEFTATVSPSPTDVKFGFYKRPSLR